MTRNSHIDNIRGVLILSVLFGHILSHGPIESWLYGLYVAIYTVHMPLMILISGYFSLSLCKRSFSQILQQNVYKLLVPFIVINILYRLLTSIVLNRDISMTIFKNPSYATWFLLALFVYRISIKYVVKFKYYLPLSLLVTIITPLCSLPILNHYSLYRIFGFYFFFLLGYYIRSNINDLQVFKLSRVKLVIITSCVIGLNYALYTQLGSDTDNLYKLASAYTKFTNSAIIFMVYKVIAIGSSLAVSVIIFNVVTNKQSILQYPGVHSMEYYESHIFLIPILEMTWFSQFIKTDNMLVLLLLDILLLLIFIVITTTYTKLKANVKNYLTSEFLLLSNNNK